MQPRYRSFDNPAIDSEPAPWSVLRRASWGWMATGTQVVAMLDGIIGPIAVQFSRPFARMPDPTGHGRDFIHDVQCLLDVWHIRTGAGDGQGDPWSVRHHVVLGPQFAAISRVFPGFLTSAESAHVTAVDAGARPRRRRTR